MKTNRNKVIKALVAAVIIMGSVLSLGIKFYVDAEALTVDRPTFIKVTPDNDIALMLGNTIYIIDEKGATNNVFDLDKKDFRARGDFDFFSNGDLLFYSSNVEPSTLEKLAQFARIKETRQEPVSGNDGLYRCDVETKSCQLFTADLPAFYTTFRVFIDRTSDTVYLADTPRFVLYKLGKDGNLLAQNNNKLWFPNQIFLYDNNLYIANTNHHSIKVVRSDTEHFGEEVENHEAIISASHIWPSEVIKTPKAWWLGIADNNMDNSRVQIFDENWKKLGEPLLKGTDADSRSLALYGDEVWVTDWTKIKIYRFNLSGERLTDFSNKEINQVISNSNRLIKKYETISSNGLTAFFIVFAMGIVAAFVLEKEETFKLFKKQNDYLSDDIVTDDLVSPPGEGVYWIDHVTSKYRKIATVVFSIALIYLMWSLSQVLTSESKLDLKFSVLIISSIPFMVMMFWAWYQMSKTRIGILGEMLLVDDGQGNIGEGKGESVKYSKSIMVVNDVVVIIGQPYKPLFPKDELKQWVAPRMCLGESVGQWYIWKILWRQKHPSVITAIGFFVYLAVIVVLGGFK